MSGRKEGRVERGPPAEAEAEGSKRPPLPAPLTPRSSTGGPRLRIPSHDRRAGRGWRHPRGGRPGMGWRAPRPPHARNGWVAPIFLSRLPVGPQVPLPPTHPRGLLAVSSDVSLPPTQCRLGDVVPGCEILGSSQATQPRGLRPYLLLRRRHQRFTQTCRSPARFGVDVN